MCSTQRTASIFPAHRSHGQSKLVPPKTWDDLFTAWSSITTSHGQPPVTPSYREARSQGVLIITQNLREAELVYLRTIVPSIDKPWRGSGGLFNNCIHLALQKRHRGSQARVSIPELFAGRETRRNLTHPHHWCLPSLGIQTSQLQSTRFSSSLASCFKEGTIALPCDQLTRALTFGHHCCLIQFVYS